MISLPPLTLYMHFPWCIRKCPYCDFNSHKVNDNYNEKQYIQRLKEDLTNDLCHVQERAIDSIFLGGGTPSLFSGESMIELFTFIRQKLDLAKDCEITIEANPGAIDSNHFAGYREAGINRISIGAQSFNPKHLQTLGRIHQDSDIGQAISIARYAGFDNINLDIMYGLPDQTNVEALDDLQQALSLQPTHFSWYQLTIEPNTVFYKSKPRLPNEDIIDNIETSGHRLLERHNMHRYEVSAYSLPSRNCRHNKHYWQYADYLGIGAGAHSKITYPQDNAVYRYAKVKQPTSYLNKDKSFLAKKDVVKEEERLFEFMLNALRLFEPISLDLFEVRAGLSRESLIEHLSEPLAKDLVKLSATHVTTTPRGKRYLNSLQTMFLS